MIEVSGKGRTLLRCFVVLLTVLFLPPFTGQVYSEDDLLSIIEKRQKELDAREASLKIEEKRLKDLQEELDQKIKKYTELLRKINQLIDKMEQKASEEMGFLVKVYESMPPEDAGSRLSALKEEVAARILKSMKPRKAGAILATMEPDKVASIIGHLSPIDRKKIPIR